MGEHFSNIGASGAVVTYKTVDNENLLTDVSGIGSLFLNRVYIYSKFGNTVKFWWRAVPNNETCNLGAILSHLQILSISSNKFPVCLTR